jgi:pyroglutamyl-peptidase
MRLAFLLLLLAAMVVRLVAEDAPPAPRLVLVTGFGPFDGRGVNGSATVARALADQRIGDATVRVLILPVRWGEPEAKLPALVAELHPALVIGLGEGYPGKVAVERVAHNRAEGPDVAGKPPASSRLDASPAATRAATLAFDAAWFSDAGLPVVASDDAGAYLCNDLMWTALGTAAPRAGFVHLPPQGDEADDAYRARLLPIVQRLIERNLAR